MKMAKMVLARLINMLEISTFDAEDEMTYYDEEKFDEFYENQKEKPIRVEKIGRNDPCPCRSGIKYKKCCLGK